MLRNVLKITMLFLIGMIGVSMFLGSLIKYNTTFEKIKAHLTVHGDRYNHFFIGSSLIRNQVDIQYFNEILMKNGESGSGFLITDWGVRPTEQLIWLEELSTINRFRPSYIFLDLSAYPILPDDDGISLQTRFIYWRELRYFSFYNNLIKATRGGEGMTWPEIKMFLAKSVNLGLIPSYISSTRRQKSPRSYDWRVFVPTLTKPSSKFKKSDFEMKVDQLKVTLSSWKESSVGAQLIVNRLIEISKLFPDTRFGIILAPITDVTFGKNLEPTWFDLYDFNDPDRYPSLYRADDRFDSNHLLSRASREYTSRITEAFLANKHKRRSSSLNELSER